MTWKGHRWLSLAFRLFFGFVFLYACAYKIADPAAFALSVATYELLPTPLINGMAIVLPWVELTAGMMLILGFRARAGMLLITLMMLMFVVALSFALSRGLDMSCGCFASSDAGESINELTLMRDMVLLLAALYVLLVDRLPIGLDRWIMRKKGSGGAIR